ncbi:MAG: 5'-deoxyadenosine deaminase [Candidatus Poseidoniaceae archaeon]|nr:MAG: 5'-deoxyadenosine deaminase [Candidatus Poseidoniaceae archaeon]
MTILTAFLFLSVLVAPQGVSEETANEDTSTHSIVISEVLASPNGMKNNETCSNCYNATDWNGDGEYGKFSDQFIELHNPTDQAINISNWVLDDIADGGSAPCQLARNTILQPGEYVSVFINASRIELDYYDGDTVNLYGVDGTLVDSLSYPARDSWYGNSYIPLDNGTIWKVRPPTPGYAQDESFDVAQNMIGCFGISDGGFVESMLLKGRVVTMNNEDDVINEGRVLVRDGKIEAVWGGDNIPQNVDLTGVEIIETNGTIYPGLIDSHNHMHYNHIPLWDFEVHTSVKSEEGGYSNRNQWKNNPNYKRDISWMKTFVQTASMWNMADQQMKYAEVMAVAGGVTAVQGSPSSNTDAWDSMLSRNIELYNFGGDGIHTKVTTLESDYTGSHITSGNSSGSLNAWYLHLSEGVDESSRAEFDILVQNNLLVGELVVVHGTALTSAEFQKMGEVGADLAWSPLSNLLLYGDTTDVIAADQAGVRISLAPDWGPSGSKNVLHELKVADLWNTNNLNSYFSNYDLATMVTKNPALGNNWDDSVGTINAGLYADLVVMDTFHQDPYRNLIEAIDADVRLTIVNGQPVFGDVDIMSELKGDDWEIVEGPGFNKAVDVTDRSVTEGTQSWSSILADMEMAMALNPDDIAATWSSSTDSYSSMQSNVLNNIFTTGDTRHFGIITQSTHANTHIDLSQLEDYYEVPMNNGERTGVNVVLEPQDNTGGSTIDPVDETSTGETEQGNETTGGTETGRDSQCPPNCILGEDVEDASSNDSSLIGPQSLLVILVALLLVAVGLLTRGNDEDADLSADQTVIIENQWQDETKQFVPELPPLTPPTSSEEE